ncbi:MAG: S-adenosylmethionine decarboxylase [archaeon]
MEKKKWGQLLTLDLFGCDKSLLINPEKLKSFSNQIIKKINMVAHGEPLVERFGDGELYGYSLIQFIETSSITMHVDNFGNRVFIDVFSCKEFDSKKAEKFSKEFFRAKKIVAKTLYRG